MTSVPGRVFLSAALLAVALAWAGPLPAEEGAAGREDPNELRRDIVRFGTETEIAALMRELRSEGTDEMDDEIIALVGTTRNHSILTVAFNFFGERERGGLEERAIEAMDGRFYEHSETVLAAINYVGWVGAVGATPALRELIESEERRFLNTAVRAFGRVGGAAGGEAADDAAEYLVEFYEDRDVDNETRREILTALGATGSPAAVELLSRVASDGEERPFLRMAAIEALSEIGHGDGLEAVLTGVSANEPHVRSTSVAALGPFSGTAVDEAILDAFRDSFYRTRIAAARASRERGLVAAVPHLRFRAERDESPAVRVEAIRALGAIGGDEPMRILEGLFSERRNPNQVRLAAGEMLMRNDPERHLDAFIVELDEARRRNLTPLYNGLLGIIGGTQAGNMEGITRRLMSERGVIERSYALEMAANNNLVSLADEIRVITEDGNEALARRARRTLERLGLQ